MYSVEAIAPKQADYFNIFPGTFPLLAKNETTPCVSNVTNCSREQTLEALQARPLIYLPNTTPGYSNTGYILLGMILESATGKTYEEVLQEALVGPLGLKGTTSQAPNDPSRGVIINDQTSSGWNIDLKGTTAMGM